MSAFVTRGDDCPPTLPGSAVQPEPVIVGGWYPNIDPAALRDAYRFRDQNTVTPARLRAALIAAIITVGNDLVAWQAVQMAAGYEHLAEIPAQPIDGISRNVILYIRAVATTAKAEIVERTRDVDTTAAGDRKADVLEPSVAELRRDAIHAIRDLLGVSRTTIELI